MTDCLILPEAPTAADALPLTPLPKDRLEGWLAEQPPAARAWVAAVGYTAEPGSVCLLPGPDGTPVAGLLGVPETPDLWTTAALPTSLPPGTYRLAPAEEGNGDAAAPAGYDPTLAALGWALGAYRFRRYKTQGDARPPARLVLPAGCDREAVQRAAEATFLVRDLVNTPAEDMGPAELAHEAQALAQEFGGTCQVTVGGNLLYRGYPAIHAVGRASSRAPRLIDLHWGATDAPKVTLVGKGVCFDSGGLDIKPSGGMLTMKKDMGGAAHVLGLARMIMMQGLPVRLRVLIPAVENMLAGNAFKPLDVIATRQGLTVEVGNTDAEGRLVLADALTEAASEAPELIVDFATLTGAARVALGPELPALFCNRDDLAQAVQAASERTADPLWRLPLWRGYARMLASGVADTSSTGDGPFAGAITAALFLEKFVPATVPWMHLDVFAWNPADRPGRPKGGEAMGLRAVHALIADRFGR